MNRLTQNDVSKDNYLNSQIESSKAKESEVFGKIKPKEDKLNKLGDRLKDLRDSKLSIKNLWKRASIRISIWKEQANLNNLYVARTKYHCAALLFQSVKDQVNEGLTGIDVILKNANTTLGKIHNLKNKDLWKVDYAFKHTHKEDVKRLRSEIRGDESAANKNGSSNITNDAPETNIQTDKEGILPDNIDARNRTGNPQNTSPEETTAFTTSTLGDPENSAGQPDDEIQDEASKGVNSEENLGDVLPKEAHPEGDEPGQINGPTDEPVPDGVTPESAEDLVVDDKGKLKNSGATGHQEEPATSEEIPAKSHDDTLISSEKEPDASEKKPNFDADSTEHSLEASTHIGDKTPEIDKSKETNKGSGIMGTNPEIEAKTKELKNAVQGCVIAVGDMVNKAGSGTTASAFIKSGMIVIDGITKQAARLIQKTYEGEDSEATIKPKHDSDKSVNTETKSEKTPGTEEISKTETTKKKEQENNGELNSNKSFEIFANYKMSSYIDEHSEELAADPVLYNGAKKIVKFIPTENQKEELSKPANSSKERARNAMNACKNGEPVYFEEAEGKPIDAMSSDELKEIPAMDRLNFIKDILCQVAFLNKVGIIHRDFNVGNVIINAQDGKSEARLIDFGAAVCPSDLDVYPERFKNTTTQFTPPEGIEGPNFDKYNDYGTGILILEMIYGNEWHKEIPKGLTNAIAYTMQRGNQNPEFAEQKLKQALEKTINEWINNKDSTFSEKCKEIGFTPEQTEFVRTLLTELLQPDSEKRMSALDAARNTDKFINSQTDGNPTNSGVDTKGSKTPEKPASPAAEKTLGSIADSSEPQKTEASSKADAAAEIDTEGKNKAVEDQLNELNQDLASEDIEKLTEAEEKIFRDHLNKQRQDVPNISLENFNSCASKLSNIFFSLKKGENIAFDSTQMEFQEIKEECCKAAIESGLSELESSLKDDEISLTENDKTKFRERLNSVMQNNPDISLKDFKSKVNEEIETLKYLNDPSISSSDDSKISIARKYGYNKVADSIESMLDPEERSATLEGTTDKDAPTSGTDVTKTTTAPTVSATTTSNSEIKNVLDAIAVKGKELIETAKQLGKGTFGTVFAASVEVLGKTLNIVAKTMNSAKKIADGEATSSENLNNLQTVLDYLSKDGSVSFGKNTVSEGLTQYIAVLSQYEKAYQGESIATRINQLKTKLTELKDKASQLETMRDNLKKNPQFKNTIEANISETEKEFKKIAKAITPFTLEELNTLNDADALLDLYQEIYINAKINMEIIRESKKTEQTPLEYAEAHHIPLCLSAMPDDGQVIPDDQLIDFARKKAHEVLKSDNKAIISTQIPGENLNKCFKGNKKEPSKFDKLSMKTRVKVVQDFFTATKLLNAAGIYHNDLHFGNMQVNVVDENNAEGYILDFGRAVEVNGKNYDFFEQNFIGLKDEKFSPPEMFTKEADTNKITSTKGLEKCAVYGLGANLFSLLGGDEGLKVQNRYFPRTRIKPNPKEPQAIWDFLSEKTKNIKETVNNEINSKSEEELITFFSKEKIEKLKAEAREAYSDEPAAEEILNDIKDELIKEQVTAGVLASDVLSPEEKEMYSFFTGQETKDPEGTKNEIVKLSQKLYFQDIEKSVKEVFKEHSSEVQDKIIALMKGTTEIDPEKRVTLTQAQESLDELKLLIDPEQNRTEQNRT